jgi:hypothetical protein
MSDDSFETVGLYLHLVYHTELACIPDPPKETETGAEERLGLAKLCVLCENLQDTRGKKDTIKALVSSTYNMRHDMKRSIPSRRVVDIVTGLP